MNDSPPFGSYRIFGYPKIRYDPKGGRHRFIKISVITPKFAVCSIRSADLGCNTDRFLVDIGSAWRQGRYWVSVEAERWFVLPILRHTLLISKSS